MAGKLRNRHIPKGFPFSVLGNDLLASCCSKPEGQRGGQSVFRTPEARTNWFNTAAYAQPLAGQFGDSGRNSVAGPGIENFDMGAERIPFHGAGQLSDERRGIQRLQPHAVRHRSFDARTGSIPVDNNVNDQAQFGSSNTNFGRVVSARPGRVIQLGGKLTF